MTTLRQPWPSIEPYKIHRLQVSLLHNIYVEECGNPNGTPVIVLHGGPGAGSYPELRQFFDPSKYRIILFDQRGTGKSTPFAELGENTTWDLVDDMEVIRQHLSIDRWVVFGGSWGSTLALVYAVSHPTVVIALIVRGIYLGEKQEVDWFYRTGGIAMFYPDAWKAFREHIPIDEHSDLVEAYWQRLNSPDIMTMTKAAVSWSLFEARASTLMPDPNLEAQFTDLTMAVALARIECHYFRKDGFLPEKFIVNSAYVLADIPGVIVHGRADFVCQPLSAWRLHEAWPNAELIITPGSGHAASQPYNMDALLYATEKFAHMR